MTEGGDNGQKEARAMLDAFASVGATQFDLTTTSLSGAKESFQRGVKLADLARTLPAKLDSATAKQRNIIVRPHGLGVSFIQLDDLKADMLARIAPAVFLILKTSPASFQAWLAISGAEDRDFTRRLRKGTGADPTASGATRIAGSLNFKDKYAPDFPRVLIEKTQPGQTVTPAALEHLGLVAAPEPTRRPQLPPTRPRAARSPRQWPDYARAVEGAKLNNAGTAPDISRADYFWCKMASQRGWSIEATAARLMEESRKAQEKGNGEAYALRTARAGAGAAARERSPRPSHLIDAPKQG